MKIGVRASRDLYWNLERGVSYVEGPATGPWSPLSIYQVLHKVATWNPDHPFLVHDDRVITYGEAIVESETLATALVRAGATPDRPIALMCDNQPEWVFALLGASALGISCIPMNPRFSVREAEYVLTRSKAAVLVTTAAFGRTTAEELIDGLALSFDKTSENWASEAIAELAILCVGASPSLLPGVFDVSGCARWKGGGEVDSGRLASVPGIIQFTSGTTGFPKGVVLSQDQVLRDAWCVGQRLGMRPTDLMYSPAPFHHVGGSVLSLLMCLVHSATLAFPSRFDADEMLVAIDRMGVNVIAAVETMTRKLVRSSELSNFKGERLRSGWCAGDPEFYDRFAGMTQIYGQSECSPNATMAFYDDKLALRKEGCGFPQPGVQVGIVARGSTSPDWLPVGEIGEIMVRGWNVMQSYLNDAGATSKALSPDGWLRTGDLGRLDEGGRLHFGGRLKDSLRVGGEFVSPDEVEGVLATHRLVNAVAVVGVPDEVKGEVPCACIELPANTTNTDVLEIELQELSRKELSPFKVPQRYLFFEKLPVTESGKIQRARVREQVLLDLGLDVYVGETKQAI